MQIEENQKGTASRRGRKKIPAEKVHRNTPKELVQLYKEFNCNQLHLAKKLDVNVGYLNQLLKHGKRPSNKTEKGIDARRKLFLKTRKPKEKIPDYLKQWNHLPTEERHKAIQQYITWRNNKDGK